MKRLKHSLAAQRNTVISTEAADSFTVRRAVERPPHFASAVVVALASEIGPGFSPDISRATKERGFSPWGMLAEAHP
jgi:hypothetical protein